jgi:hypothetical protein
MNAPVASTRLPEEVHPSPHRDRIAPWALWTGSVAAPLAWLFQLAIDTFIGSNACYALDAPRTDPLWAVAPALAVVDITAIAVALAAGWLSWRNWRASSHERPGHAHHLIASGDGRLRFMAMGAMISTGMVALAMVYGAVSHAMVVGCGT